MDVDGRRFEGMPGRSKKQAEQGAAKNTFLTLQADGD